MRLQPGKIAIVTGGANGIGAGTAKMLASHGVTVLSFDWDEAENRALCASNPLIHAVTCNCADYQDIRRCFETAMEQFGGVDILVNNVGSFRDSSFLKESYADAMSGFEEMVRSCAGSTYAFTQLAAPIMAARGEGAIINVLTNHVHRDICRVSAAEHAYDAAKYAQLSLNMSMAAELRPHGIRVNAVDPASTDTKMLRDFFSARGIALSAESIGRMTGTVSLLTAEEVGMAICNLIRWEDPAPVGKNYLLQFREDCERLNPPCEV